MNLELAADRDRAVTVPCPPPPRGCGSLEGEPCYRTDGEPLEHFPAHDARLKAAGVVHAPLDSRDLRAAHERTPR